MLRDIVTARPLSGHRLAVVFDNGVTGETDVSELVEFTGIFEPLQDQDYFRQVQVNLELGVVCWPNGADLDTDVLYAELTGDRLQKLPESVFRVEIDHPVH